MSILKKMIPHIQAGRFYNYPHEKPHAVFLPSLYMYIKSWYACFFRSCIPADGWTDHQKPVSSSIEPIITWIGHATFLIQIGGVNIITDPIFTHPSILFKRMLLPGIISEQLPPIHVVALSHNHPDHMSRSCLQFLKKKFQPLVVVPQKLSSWFSRRGFSSVQECTWWEKITIPAKDGINGTIDLWFLPSRHWSGRGLFDRNKTLWGSWLISYNNHTIYFGGDTAYGPHFAQIGAAFPNIHTALLPIGPCDPEELLSHSHINADQALQALIDLKAHRLIPMHWGTFHFGMDHFITPITYLRKAWENKKNLLASHALHIAKMGEQVR